MASKAVLCGCAALLVFAAGLGAKSFADEYAYMSQSYYADLAFEGRLQDKLWLDFGAFDLQPLPKYLIGISFRLAHVKPPSRGDAINWYQHYDKFGDLRALRGSAAAHRRHGSTGHFGHLRLRGFAQGPAAGMIAAGLLMLNPLYRLLAHRAMSDVPCEALCISALAVFLWAALRIWRGLYTARVAVAPALAGVAAGGAVLCKFNGFLALFIIAAWCLAAWIIPGLALTRKLAFGLAMAVTIFVAVWVSVALNPYLTAKPTAPVDPLPRTALELIDKSPWQRFRFQVEHRVNQSADQKRNFPDDALYTLAEKAKVVLIQGFGRFGPLGPFESDSTQRFSIRQDWGLCVWLPFVVIGFLETMRLARARFEPVNRRRARRF